MCFFMPSCARVFSRSACVFVIFVCVPCSITFDLMTYMLCTCLPAVSVMSVHSQPCESHSLLQVPDISPVHPRSPPSLSLPRIAPPTPSPSPRALHRQVRDPVSRLYTHTHIHTFQQLLIPMRSAFLLQVALKVDSVESQGFEQQERTSSVHLPPLSPSQLPPHPSSLSSPLPASPSSPSAFPRYRPSPLPPLLSSPSSLPPPPSSPSLLLPPPPSPRAPLRPASLRRPRPPSAISLCDPADEEVYHITSSAGHRWWAGEGGGTESKVKVGRSHSLSPYTLPSALDSYSTFSPPPPPLPPSSSRSALSLLGAGLKDRDFRKGFSIDNQGFLDKPPSLNAGYADDQRRHSIEVCLPRAGTTSSNEHFTEEAYWLEKGGPVRVQSVRSNHRKKKMSPPCISIHPPSEREHAETASPPKLSDCSTMLRRRTPSYDLTPHMQSNTNAQDASSDANTQSPMHRSLTPVHVPLRANSPTRALAHSRPSTPTRTQTHTPPHAYTPTHPHIPISPNVFIQPHTPLVPMPFSQTRPVSPDAGHIPLPQFTFDQPQSRYMSGLSAGISDTDTATCSSPFDSRLGSGAGFSAKNRRTAQ